MTTCTLPTNARGFPPVVAYVHMESLAGAPGNSTGTLSLRFEERYWKY